MFHRKIVVGHRELCRVNVQSIASYILRIA